MYFIWKNKLFLYDMYNIIIIKKKCNSYKYTYTVYYNGLKSYKKISQKTLILLKYINV